MSEQYGTERRVDVSEKKPDFSSYVYILFEENEIRGVFDIEETAVNIREMFSYLGLTIKKYKVFE